jgi:uncharacterized membrane protein
VATENIARRRSGRRPIHPMIVIFPLAFFIGSLAFDVLSLIGLKGTVLTGGYLLAGGLIGALIAIVTGLIDRSGMRPGSQIRRVATRHMYIQLTATAIFLVELIVRWAHTFPAAHRVDKAEVLWVVLGALGVAAIVAGGDVGFNMVFRMGAGVEGRRPAGADEAAEPAAAEAAQPPGTPS